MMERNDLENLLVAYGRAKQDTPVLSDTERTQLQASIQSQLEKDEEEATLPASTPFRRLAIWGVAAAAMVGFALLLPSPRHELTLRAYTAGGLRAGDQFEIQITTSRPTYVALIVLDDQKSFFIVDSSGGVGKKVERQGILGSYSLRVHNTKGELTLRTDAIVVACAEPIDLEKLAWLVPDKLTDGKTVQAVCSNLEASLGCEAAHTSIHSK